MTVKIAYVHTVASLAGIFSDLSRELLPAGIEVYHISDELLLKVVLAQGGLSPFIYQRVLEHALAAEGAGAAAVQFTCSSISPCVEACQPFAGIPLLKIDEPMVDHAVQMGPRIGVAATAPTTLRPTTELVHARAARQGCAVQVEPVLVEGAYAALTAGDLPAHDRLILEQLRGLAARSDVVILAQASMARVAAAIPPREQGAPILSSPRLAVERLAQVLAD